MRLTRRAALRGAALATLAGAASAPPGARAAPRTPVEVVLLTGDGAGPGEPPGLPAVGRALLRAFRAQVPQVPVRLDLARPSLLAATEAVLAGRRPPPDVLVVPPPARTLPGADTLMYNLEPVRRAAGLGGDIYPSLLAYGSTAGRLLVAPLFRDPLVVYYNVDAFSRSGLAPPAGGWTLAEFRAACAGLAARAPAPVRHPLANATRRYDPELLAAFVTGFGGDLTPYDPLTGARYAGLTSAEGLRGIAALLDLRAFEPAHTARSPRELFARGEAALYFGHQRDLDYVAAAVGDAFAWDLAPMPLFPVRAAVPVQALGTACTTERAADRTGAVTLALYGLTDLAQRSLAATGAGVPASERLAGATLWRQAMPPVNLEPFVQDPGADVVVPPVFFHSAQLAAALRLTLDGAPPARAFAAAQATLALTPPWKGL